MSVATVGAASGVGLSASAAVPPDVNNIANQPIIAAVLAQLTAVVGSHEPGLLIADVAPHGAAVEQLVDDPALHNATVDWFITAVVAARRRRGTPDNTDQLVTEVAHRIIGELVRQAAAINQLTIAAAGPQGAAAGQLITVDQLAIVAVQRLNNLSLDVLARLPAAIAAENQRQEALERRITGIVALWGLVIVGSIAGWLVGSPFLGLALLASIEGMIGGGVYIGASERLTPAWKAAILIISILAGIGVGLIVSALLCGFLITPAGVVVSSALVALGMIFLAYKGLL